MHVCEIIHYIPNNKHKWMLVTLSHYFFQIFKKIKVKFRIIFDTINNRFEI